MRQIKYISFNRCAIQGVVSTAPHMAYSADGKMYADFDLTFLEHRENDGMKIDCEIGVVSVRVIGRKPLKEMEKRQITLGSIILIGTSRLGYIERPEGKILGLILENFNGDLISLG